MKLLIANQLEGAQFHLALFGRHNTFIALFRPSARQDELTGSRTKTEPGTRISVRILAGTISIRIQLTAARPS